MGAAERLASAAVLSSAFADEDENSFLSKMISSSELNNNRAFYHHSSPVRPAASESADSGERTAGALAGRDDTSAPRACRSR